MFDLGDQTESLAREVIGAAIEVHRTLGPGYLESVYEKALSVELKIRDIDHVCQDPVGIEYKGEDVGEGRIDLRIGDRLIVELKSVDQFAPIHQAQVISCLKATSIQLGLLINFNTPVLKEGIKRIVLT